MGCRSSRPTLPMDPFHPEKPPTPRPPVAVTASDDAAARDHKLKYDTPSSASLVMLADDDAGTTFQGILAGKTSKLDMAHRRHAAVAERVATAVHACDDSTLGIPKVEQDARVKTYANFADFPLSAPATSFCDGVTVVRGVAMSMPYAVLIAGKMDDVAVLHLCEQIEVVFVRAHFTVNGWNSQSDVARLNAAPADKAVSISQELARLFDIVDELVELTEGRFDPTACILNLAWTKLISDEGRPPLPEDIWHLRFAIGWNAKIKRRTSTSVSRRNTNTAVDVDGVAKGFVVDMLFESLYKNLAAAGEPGSQPSLYIDWAGDIRACGKHPSGRPWRTAVMKPPTLQRIFKCWEEGTLANCLEGVGVTQFVDLRASGVPDGGGAGSSSRDTTSSKGMSIATSGDYHQVKRFGYHHIVNPVSMTVMKAGARSVGSVSVMASSCALADGLATAAMTCDTAADAAQLMKRVIAQAPRQVFGYCIVGRGTNKSSEVFISSFFKAASAADVDGGSPPSSSALTCSAGSEDVSWKLTPALDNVGRRAVVEGCARVACIVAGEDGLPIGKVDSLSLLSMQGTEPYVTYMLCAETAKVLPTEGQLLSLTVPTDDYDGIRTPSESKLKLRVIRTLAARNPEGLDMIVVAAVADAIMGSCRTTRVTYRGRQYGQPIPGWPILPTYPIPSILVRTMEILKRMPTQVWIVTGESAVGKRCGVTAGSVVSSATSPNVLTFNLLKTSAFYASFCGLGTLIRLFMLAAGRARLAERFFKTVEVTGADMDELQEGAAFSLDVVVEQAEPVLDHLLVVCRVRQVVALGKTGDEAGGVTPVRTPLLRIARGYTRLGQSGPDPLER